MAHGRHESLRRIMHFTASSSVRSTCSGDIFIERLLPSMIRLRSPSRNEESIIGGFQPEVLP